MPPIYDYICRQCKHEWEEFTTTMSEAQRLEKEQPCPNCGTLDKERKVVTGTSFQLKGGGWAKDLYGGRGSKGE